MWSNILEHLIKETPTSCYNNKARIGVHNIITCRRPLLRRDKRSDWIGFAWVEYGLRKNGLDHIEPILTIFEETFKIA